MLVQMNVREGDDRLHARLREHGERRFEVDGVADINVVQR